MQNCISIGAVGTIILAFSLIAGIVLIAAAFPAAFIRLWYSQKNCTLQLDQIEMERKSWYFHHILTSTHYAKEIRLFDIGPFFGNVIAVFGGTPPYIIAVDPSMDIMTHFEIKQATPASIIEIEHSLDIAN